MIAHLRCFLSARPVITGTQLWQYSHRVPECEDSCSASTEVEVGEVGRFKNQQDLDRFCFVRLASSFHELPYVALKWLGKRPVKRGSFAAKCTQCWILHAHSPRWADVTWMGFPRETQVMGLIPWDSQNPRAPRTPHLVIGSRSNLKPPTDAVLILLQPFFFFCLSSPGLALLFRWWFNIPFSYIFLFPEQSPFFSHKIQIISQKNQIFSQKIYIFSHKHHIFCFHKMGPEMELQERWSKSLDLMTQVPSWLISWGYDIWYEYTYVQYVCTYTASLYMYTVYIYIWYMIYDIWYMIYDMVWYDMIWIEYIYLYIYKCIHDWLYDMLFCWLMTTTRT